MSLVITIAAQKKLPHPTHQFGSIQATVSLQGEAGSLADAPTVMRNLFQAAQTGVDEHLAQQVSAMTSAAASPAKPSAQPQHLAPPPASKPSSTSAPATQPSAASRPYPSNGKRAPAPVTEAQLRFLDKLINQSKTTLDAILQHHQIGSLRDLSCKAATGLIDELKARVPA